MAQKLRVRSASFAICCALGFILVNCASAQPLLTTERIATGLNRPVFVTAAPGDDSRLFIVEQSGSIKIYDKNARSVLSTPFLNVASQLSSGGGEEGLLGLAFSPNFATDGQFYINMTTRPPNQSLRTEVRRYTVSAENPNVANDASSLPIINFDQPFSNHNAGWLGFSPKDGYLYVATGDGGSGNDPGNRAQDITDQKLGKMLRLDVSQSSVNAPYAIPSSNPFVNAEGDDEIWAYGLRNPWRNSFDRQTGDLWIADVGQNLVEEVNFQPAESLGGENYGWRVREGNQFTGLSGGGPNFQSTLPIHTYSHSVGQSITGGYVYRGSAIGGVTPLDGVYFFADYARGRIFSMRESDGLRTDLVERTNELRPPSSQGSISTISSFGEDNQGNLYIVDLGGEVFRLLAVPAIGDVDKDGDVDLRDFSQLRTAFGNQGQGLNADLDSSGAVDLVDFSLLRNHFGTDSRTQRGALVPELGSRSLTIFFALICLALSIRRRRGRYTFFSAAFPS